MFLTINQRLSQMSRKLTIGVCVLFLSVGLIWGDGNSASSNAALIARCMRELQARHRYLGQVGYFSSYYLVWPSITCGNIESPPFPPDNWYQSQFEQEGHFETAILCTRDIVSAFQGLMNRHGSSNLSYFIHPNSIGLEGLGCSSHPQYLSSIDSPSSLSFPVDENNFRLILNDISQAVVKLKTIQVRTIELIDIANRSGKGCMIEGEIEDLPAAAQAASSGSCCATHYGENGGYLQECSWNCARISSCGNPWSPISNININEPTCSLILDGFGVSLGEGSQWIGLKHCGTYDFDNDLDIDICDYHRSTVHNYYFATFAKHATRWRFRADLTNYNGSTKFYVGLDINQSPSPLNVSDQLSEHNMGGFKKKDRLWQGISSPSTGQVWTSAYYANIEPTFISIPQTLDPDNFVHSWELKNIICLNNPSYDTSPNQGISSSNPTIEIYKTHKPDTVYSAHVKCTGDKSGETVCGKVICPWNTTDIPLNDPTCKLSAVISLIAPYPSDSVATLTVGGHCLNSTSTTICIPKESLRDGISNVYAVPFSISAGKGDDDLTFQVTFWKQTGSGESLVTSNAEEKQTFHIVGNHYNCCSKEESKSNSVFKAPILTRQKNPDVEVYFPQEPDEAYILTPTFMHGIKYETPTYAFTLYGANDLVTTDDITFNQGVRDAVVLDYGGIKLVYRVPSDWWNSSNASTITVNNPQVADSNNHLIKVIYSGDICAGNLCQLRDAKDPDNRYTEYQYENGRVATAIEHAGTESRTYKVYYDSSGRVIEYGGHTDGGCPSCGGSGNSNITYEYNTQGLPTKEMMTVRDEIGGIISQTILKEYQYDSDGQLISEYQGAIQNNRLQRKILRKTQGEYQIVDTYEYVEQGQYRVSRQYLDSTSHPIRTVQYENMNENPDNPQGRYFDEKRLYVTNPTDPNDQKTIVIPTLAKPDGTGVRKEYRTYQPTATTKRETEIWYNSKNQANEISCIDYGKVDDSTWRITSSKTNDATTEYYYSAPTDIQPRYILQPQFSGDGISAAHQLKIAYEYDDQKRVIYESKYKVGTPEQLLQKIWYDYDDFGNLEREVIYDGQNTELAVTRYLYNGFDEQILMKSPEGVVSGKAYDSMGHLISEFVLAEPAVVNFDSFTYTSQYSDKINLGTSLSERYLLISQTRYEYDALGRLEYIKKAKSDGTFRYGIPGDQSLVMWITTKYEYDSYGRRQAEIQDARMESGGNPLPGHNAQALNLRTVYDFNLQDQVERTTNPNGRWRETYWDGRGQVITEIDGFGSGQGRTEVSITEYLYDARGNLQKTRYPDGSITYSDYDDFGRIKIVRKGLHE